MRIRRRTPRLPRPLWRGRATSPRLPRPRRGGRATPPRQPALPDTPVARLEALTGARQEWLLRCRHALAAGPAALDGLLTGSPEIGEALTEDARTGWSGVAATPALSAAEAMLRTAQALAADDPPPPAAARHWRAASVLLPARPADERGEPEVSDRPAADFVRLLGEVLGGDPPRRVASATVPVLLYRPRQRIGLRADLTLTCVAGGPPGLHPDPEAMAFGLGDAGFVAGLEAAWAQSPLAARKRCVLWSVTDGSGAPVNDIAQGSLGAAFGLALDELRRRLRPVMGRFSFRLLRRVHVLSGRLRPDGGLEAVGGLRAKLQVAKDAGYRVILPRDNRAEAERHARELGVRLCYAADLPRALRLARRVHLWRVAGALALVLLLVGGVLGGKWLLTQADRQRAAERAELVGGSRSLAALSRSTADTDPQLADLYAAAAWDMAQTPEAEAAADAALHRPLRAVLRAGDWAAFTSADALLVDATDSVRLWDPSSGKPTGPAWQPRAGSWGTERPTARAVSLDGSRFAVGETGGVVRVRPLTEGGLEPLVDVTLIEAHPRMTVVAVALSPDGSLLATAGSPIAPRDEELFEHDRTVRLWDARTGDPRGAVLTGHQGALRALAFSPDGDMLITGSRAGRPGHESAPTLQVWDAATGEPAGVEPPQEPGVTALDVSPDGTMLAAGGEDGRTRLWNMVTGDQLAEPLDGRSDAVTAVRFATGPEGRLADVLATSGTDGTVRLWVAAVGVELAVYDTGGRSVGSLSFSPDGTALSAADDSGTVRVWDVGPAHGPGTALLDRSAQSVSVAYAPDGEAFVTAGWDGLLLRREAARPDAVRVLARTAGPLRGVAFAPDGGVVATAGGDGRVRLWDAGSGAEVRSWEAHEGGVRAVAFAPDGGVVATAGGDGRVRLWDAGSGAEVRSWEAHEGGVRAVAFAPDGGVVATAGGDGRVRLWDAGSGAEVRSWKAHEGGVHAVAFAPDGSGLATAGADAEVRLWRAGRDDDATPVRRFVTAGPAAHAVAFSDDGVWLTAGDPVGVRVWATATGRLLSVDYTGPVSGIAFAPDERAAVTTGPHRQVVAFAQRDGAPAATVVVRGETSATAQAISPDGGTTAVIGTEEIVTEPDAPAPKPPQDDESEDPPPDGEFSRAVLQLAGLSDGRVRHTVVLDVEKPSATRFLVRFTPDGNRVRIVTSGGRVFTYDTVTGAPVGRAVTLYTPGSDESAPAFTLAADPRGRYAVAYGPVTVFVDLATGRAETLSLEAASSVESLESVESVAVGPDGATLALGTREGMVLRFDRATGAARTPLRLTSGGSIEALAFHPEQDVLAVASSGRTVLWSLGEEPRPSVTLRGAAGQDVAALRFNHSGDTLAVASRNAVTLHRATTGSKITELHAWGDGVRTVEFSPGGGALHAVVEGELPPLRWDVLPSDQPVKRLCERAGRPLSRVEWDETPVGEDVEYRPVCTAS